MMQMPKDANNRELYNVIDDPNETKNLVRFEICFITCQNKFKSLRILFAYSIYMNGSINKTFCLQAGSNPEIVLELQKILRRIEPQMASARYVFKVTNEIMKCQNKISKSKIFSPRYSRPIKDGWPGRQKGRSKGMHVTGWCDQIV